MFTAWCAGERADLCPMWGGAGFHYAKNSAQFKTYEVFISGTFHLIFSDLSWPQVTETAENKIVDKGGLL